MARNNFFNASALTPLEQRARASGRPSGVGSRGPFESNIETPSRKDVLSALLQSGDVDDLARLNAVLGIADVAGPSDLASAFNEGATGLSPRSPVDIFLGKGQEGDLGVSDPDSLPGLIGQGGQRVGGALVEAIAELITAGGGVLEEGISPVGNLINALGNDQGARDALSWLTGLGGDDTTEGRTVSNALTDQAEQVMQQIKERSDQAEWVEGIIQDPERRLDAEEQETVETARDAIAADLRRLQTELNKLQNRTTEQNAILDLEEKMLFGEAGLLPGMSEEEAQRINEALDLATSGEAGLQPEVLEAVDAIVSSNLDRAGKLERLDFVMDQAEIKQNVLDTIGNVVQNRRDLDELMELSGPELLERMEIPYELTQPQFNFGFQPDPVDRQASAIGETVEEYWGTVVGGPIPPELEMQIASWTANEMQTPGWLLSPAGQTAITTVMSGYPEVKNVEGVIQAIQNGFVAGQARNKVWDEALTYTSFEPGSEALGIALTRKAVELGLPPEEASRLAESQDLHRLIQAKSGGNVGWTSDNGTQATIGGLSVEAIERVMGVPAEEVIGDTEREIEALIRYVSEFGNPQNAMQHYLRTGDWGS